MTKWQDWLYLVGAVGFAIVGNYLSTQWASKSDKFTPLLLLGILIVAPLVFITFGMVTSRLGLAVAAGTVDGLITISSMVIGMVFLHEWSKTSLYQYLGLALVLVGVGLMQITARAGG